MIEELTEFPAAEEPEHYFGCCPHCGNEGEYMNVFKSHWFVCDRDKVKWYVGYNLFSSWQEETKEDWDRNAAKLEGYRQVRPYRGMMRDFKPARVAWTHRLIRFVKSLLPKSKPNVINTPTELDDYAF